MKNKKEFRMYSMALYQLSGIQAGIQAGHAWVEYGVKTKDVKRYEEWAENHKTVIVLDGGTTNTMKEHIKMLNKLDIECVEFHEPDLGGVVTAFSFLLDSDQMSDPLISIFLRKFKLHGK